MQEPTVDSSLVPPSDTFQSGLPTKLVSYQRHDMRLNETTAIVGEHVVLVPYRSGAGILRTWPKSTLTFGRSLRSSRGRTVENMSR